MQVDGAAHGVGTIPRRRRLNVLLAIVAVVVIVVLMVWAPQLSTSGVGAQDANLNAGAGSAVIHDDAGNMPPEVVGAGSAIIHDDPGNVNR